MTVASSIKNIINHRSWPVKAYQKQQKLAKEFVWINDYKIKVGGSLKDTARAINKIAAKTGVRAKILTDKGVERLVLTIRSKKIDIRDPKGVFAKLFTKGYIGKTKDCVIQILGSSGNTRNIKINYNIQLIKNPLVFDSLKLSIANIIQLAHRKEKVEESIVMAETETVFEQIGLEMEDAVESINKPEKAIFEYKQYEYKQYKQDIEEPEVQIPLSNEELNEEQVRICNEATFNIKNTTKALLTFDEVDYLNAKLVGRSAGCFGKIDELDLAKKLFTRFKAIKEYNNNISVLSLTKKYTNEDIKNERLKAIELTVEVLSFNNLLRYRNKINF
jgi:hypothetical protein